MLEKLNQAHQAILDVPCQHAVGSKPFNCFMEVRGVVTTYNEDQKSLVVKGEAEITLRQCGQFSIDIPDLENVGHGIATTVGHLAKSMASKLKSHGDFYVHS